MRRYLCGLAVAVAGLAAAPASAGPLTQTVNIEFADFAPSQLDALPGDTIRWTNSSVRDHTVTADDGSFGSGTVSANGGTYTLSFGTPGVYSYHCTIHPSMVGEVDVSRVTLDPITGDAVVPGQRVQVSGRSADGSAPITVEQSGPGGFQTVATAVPGADGAWSASFAAATTADVRAVSGGDSSETRRLLVMTRRASVRANRQGVSVTVAPLDPGGRVVLEVYLRERFGWWPLRWARLDYASRAFFRLRGPARARVEIVDRDGWTPLFTSQVVRVPKSR